MLGAIILLLICLAGMLVILGFTSAGFKLLFVAVLLCFIAPLVMCFLGQAGAAIGNVLWWAIGIAGVVVAIIVIVRFTNHRRQYEKWWGEGNTSQKKRLER